MPNARILIKISFHFLGCEFGGRNEGKLKK